MIRAADFHKRFFRLVCGQYLSFEPYQCCVVKTSVNIGKNPFPPIYNTNFPAVARQLLDRTCSKSLGSKGLWLPFKQQEKSFGQENLVKSANVLRRSARTISVYSGRYRHFGHLVNWSNVSLFRNYIIQRGNVTSDSWLQFHLPRTWLKYFIVLQHKPP